MLRKGTLVSCLANSNVYAIARTNEFVNLLKRSSWNDKRSVYSLFLILAGGIVIFWAKQSAKLKQ